MDDLWYQMIFKRKSFHIFKDRQTISDIELRNIEENIKKFKSLDEGIKTAFQIVPQRKRPVSVERSIVSCFTVKRKGIISAISVISGSSLIYTWPLLTSAPCGLGSAKQMPGITTGWILLL